jgi:hypothetical protein
MKQLFAGFVAVGIVLLVASVVWPKVNSGTSSWTDEKAKEFQDVSLQYHNLSFRDLNKEENRRQLEEAKTQFDALKSELDSVRARSAGVATWLWWSGVVLAVVGAGGVLTTRES